MAIELTYKISLSIPDLRAISECPSLPLHIREKADRQITKAVHGLTKPTHVPKGKEAIENGLERVKVLASESGEEREERIDRELREEEERINAMFGL